MTDPPKDPIEGAPPQPTAPFDPSTQEHPIVKPEPQAEESESLRPRHGEGVSMDTETFMAIPVPVPSRPFEPPQWEKPRSGRLARSAAFFALATTASRVAGLIREVFAAGYFGVKGPMSAFTIAFQVPNLVRSLFADAAIQAAFVPVFTELLEKGNKREAFRLASTLIFLVTMVLGAVTAIFVLAAPVVMPIFAPGFEGEVKHLTIALSQILFPILIMLGATGMVVGVLNSYDRFAAFAISPFFWNLAIIVVLVLLAPAFPENKRIYAYAIGVLVGTAIQFAIPAWDLRNTPFQLRPRLTWTPEVRRVLLLMLPVTLSLGLINFNLLINSFFGTLVSDQAPAAIDKAFRIYMLPQGIFSVAVSTVVFPTLSRFAARGAYDDLRATMANGMRQIILLLVPAAAAVLVLSVPMVRLVYERGAFDAGQTSLVATALFWFAFSLPFNGLFLIQTRTFFSLQRPWVPSAISGVNLAITALAALILYKPFGIGGIVAATVIATASSVLAQAIILRRRLGGLELTRFVDTASRVLLSAGCLAAVSYFAWYGLDQALGRSIAAQVASMCAALGAGSITYFLAAKALRIPEVDQILRLVRRG